ncbi:MAG: Tyrosine-tRNA ligase [Candidatus Gottesmanbacteria bacterium GW2011_GWA1_43_11]|uniref:Tyrosine--tRNA ligase n=1 Tax=Candidatus Gottesmanbacteria bacterium GW2011_GWA1_43_11 TaxID=1618436 RepID=A0A0G1ENA1_9BACT|nr:MAG: Tyrosine-tRNA ligase [Candidatus Gottesmanbacteria bacterium GW2011_GWA1_43_11]
MDAIDTLLTRGVDQIYPSREALEKVLRSGKKLKLYQGFDPTGTQLHIGHMVGFRKLRQWQDLGHEVIFLIGDGTGQAGDPSGKKRSREKYLTQEELRQNGRDYVLQSGKIMLFDGPNPVRILYNADWLNKLSLVEILTIAGHFTLQQMLERDLYQERLKSNEDVSLREFMYPLLQGYDSVAMQVDLELGGSDQMFNMLAGRKLVKSYLNKEKYVMTVPLLTDSKGTKIGKTEGNVIGLTDAPHELFSKIMALGDDAIINCFILLTDKPEAEISEMKKQIAGSTNPMTFKKLLAWEITAQLNNPTQATQAQDYFEKTFQSHDLSHVEEFKISNLSANPIAILELLMQAKTAASKSEARRLVEQNAVEVDQTVVDIVNTNVTLKSGMTLRVGKKKFLRFT